MTDQEKAQRLLDMARRRLAGCEIALLEEITKTQGPVNDKAFIQLCTEFAAYLT